MPFVKLAQIIQELVSTDSTMSTATDAAHAQAHAAADPMVVEDKSRYSKYWSTGTQVVPSRKNARVQVSTKTKSRGKSYNEIFVLYNNNRYSSRSSCSRMFAFSVIR